MTSQDIQPLNKQQMNNTVFINTFFFKANIKKIPTLASTHWNRQTESKFGNSHYKRGIIPFNLILLTEQEKTTELSFPLLSLKTEQLHLEQNNKSDLLLIPAHYKQFQIDSPVTQFVPSPDSVLIPACYNFSATLHLPSLSTVLSASM